MTDHLKTEGWNLQDWKMTDEVAGWNLQDWKMTDWKMTDWKITDQKMTDYEQEQTHVLHTLKTFNVYDMQLFEAQI